MLMQKLEHKGNVEMGGSRTTKPEITFQAISNAVGYSLSDLERSQDQQDWEDKDNDEKDSGHGKLIQDDEPRWSMGTISTMVPHRMERIWQKQMRLDELKQQG
jgi:hypothetical protein